MTRIATNTDHPAEIAFSGAGTRSSWLEARRYSVTSVRTSAMMIQIWSVEKTSHAEADVSTPDGTVMPDGMSTPNQSRNRLKNSKIEATPATFSSVPNRLMSMCLPRVGNRVRGEPTPHLGGAGRGGGGV